MSNRRSLAIACTLALVTLAGTALAAPVPAPSNPAPVSLLRVRTPSPEAWARLAALDLDVIGRHAARSADVLGGPEARAALASAGLAYEVVESDWGRALAARNDWVPAPATLAGTPPFGSGSMGGYYTLAEINEWLDNLAANDAAGIVSAVVTIGTSRQGRAIRAVRIGNESLPDHSRPRVLLTALTHAREPGGMQSILYFIDRLVTNYGTDPDLTYLVDQREIWCVPVVNPDGYIQNETVYFGGMGFGSWRKNARDNDGDMVVEQNEGVDINRNFGYQWGFNNTGSSPTSTSATYRGPSAFSEPETQALRDFCNLHGFRTADNYHTYSELCLYPWGYNGLDSPDASFYIRLADGMLKFANYAYGVPQDILYSVNGDANDWMYGEQTSKPKVLAVTTEVGTQNDGFWPAASRIVPLAHLQLHPNIVLAYSAGVYVAAESAQLVGGDGWLHPNGEADVEVTLRHAGLDATTGGVTVTATASTPGITVLDGVSTYAALAPGTTAGPAGGDRLRIAAEATVAEGTRVPLVLAITDAGNYVRHDSVYVTVGQPLTVFSDAASGGLGNWSVTAGTWGIQMVSGNPMFSDSPSGSYADGADARLTLNVPLDLSGGSKAYLHFNHRWDVEEGYDFCTVEASTNGGGSWTPLHGAGARAAHGTTGAYSGGAQDAGTWGYDATQRFVVPEYVDLSAYAGTSNLRLRFRLRSDFGTVRDGWLLDDVQVLVYPEDATDVEAEGGARRPLEIAMASANPFRDDVRVAVHFARTTVFRAAVYGVDGRLVRPLAAGIAAPGRRQLVWDGRTAAGTPAASGTYLVRVESAAGTAVQRVTRLR